MTTFIFRCPHTGLNVQGFTTVDYPDEGDQTYEAIACTACGDVHFVDPKTGRVIGQKEN